MQIYLTTYLEWFFGTYSDIQEINGIYYTKTRMKYKVDVFVYLIVVLLARTKYGCIHIERFRDIFQFHTIFRVYVSQFSKFQY